MIKFANAMYTSTTEIKSLHSTPDPDELFKYLNVHYNLPKESYCKYFFRGSNDIYKVYTPSANLYLRLASHGARSEQCIHDEIDLLNLWKKNGADHPRARSRNPTPLRSDWSSTPDRPRSLGNGPASRCPGGGCEDPGRGALSGRLG